MSRVKAAHPRRESKVERIEKRIARIALVEDLKRDIGEGVSKALHVDELERKKEDFFDRTERREMQRRAAKKK